MSIPIPPTPAPIIQILGAKKKDPDKNPQEHVAEFWEKFFTKKPGKVTSIFPRSLYSTLLPPESARGAATIRNAAESYEAAARECRERVKRVVRECNRTNEKFTDPDFDIESDMHFNCLNGLVREGWPWDWFDLFEMEDSGAYASYAAGVSSSELKQSIDTLANSRLLGDGSLLPVDVKAMQDFVGGGGENASAGWSASFATAAKRRAERKAQSKAQRGNGLQPPQMQKGEAQQSQSGANIGPPQSRNTRGNGVECGEWYDPGSIKRVDWIFEKPQFTVDGFAASDIKQGGNGDCWWLAAIATIAHRRDLMEKVCVARDEEIGVYGFVFQRDGEFVPVLVDDNLYLSHEDFDFYGDQYDATGKKGREYRKRYQTNSDALYFAKCQDPNETWLPLLEKAYAKFHGDYESISGGWSGEAVEDMTGGVTTTVASNRVLRKDKLWRELVNSDSDFVFALSAIGTGWDYKKGGLALGHAYSILKATEEIGEDGQKVRLVQIRNPWGQRSRSGVGEWNGPWSDGSKEWTPYWLKKLGHVFGDDGVFWMSYEDMLETFMYLHRTRLFDEKWTVVQQWTNVDISWVTGYLQSKFVLEVKKGGLVVIMLTQLDERFFVGLEGQYTFALHFVLQEENGKPGEHICRVRPVHEWENRSVSCEIELEAGKYEVIPKITATRVKGKKMVEDIVKAYAEKNPQKLRQIGMQYDLAHSKGGVADEDLKLEKSAEEKKKKEEEKKKKKEEKKKRKAERKLKRKERAKKQRLREKERAKKEKAEAEKKAKEEEEAKKKEEAEAKEAEAKAKAEEAAAKAAESKDDGKAAETKSGDGDEKKVEDSDTIATPTESVADDKLEEKPAEKPVEKPAEKGEDSKAKESTGDTAAASTEEKPAEGEKKEEEKKEEEKKADEEEDDDDEDLDDTSDEEEEEEEEKKPEEAPADEEELPTPWNAVCVIGLRVYSRDPEVTVKLVKPKDAEEAAALSVDSTAPGATM